METAYRNVIKRYMRIHFKKSIVYASDNGLLERYRSWMPPSVSYIFMGEPIHNFLRKV